MGVSDRDGKGFVVVFNEGLSASAFFAAEAAKSGLVESEVGGAAGDAVVLDLLSATGAGVGKRAEKDDPVAGGGGITDFAGAEVVGAAVVEDCKEIEVAGAAVVVVITGGLLSKTLGALAAPMPKGLPGPLVFVGEDVGVVENGLVKTEVDAAGVVLGAFALLSIAGAVWNSEGVASFFCVPRLG